MQYRTLGRSGLRVSVVGLGTNNFARRIDLPQAREVVDKALDLGVTFIDTAASYGAQQGQSEAILGEILKGRRHDVVVASKFASHREKPGIDASRNNILREVEDSLRRLKTDYLDLYQVHFPDPQTPIEETLYTLDQLVRQGKVRYLGSSNFSAWQVVDAHWQAERRGLQPFVSAQNEYSLLARQSEQELLPALRHVGAGLIPYYPLAYGLLSGKYQRGQDFPADSRLANWTLFAERQLVKDSWSVLDQLQQFAVERGHSLLSLAWAWLAAQPGVSSIIAGATQAQQVEQNVAALDWKLSAEDLRQVDEILGSRHS